MRILLDDEPCDLTGDSVGDAIAAAADLARDKGRMIVEVMVDGRMWSPEHLDDAELIQSSADEVRLVSANPREVAAAALADAGSALDTAELHQSQAAEMIQVGKSAEGLSELNEALSIWMAIQQALEQASELVELDLDTASIGGDVTAADLLHRLQTQLEQIHEQLLSQDVVGVADSLLYDLPPVVQEWREMLARLSEEVGGGV